MNETHFHLFIWFREWCNMRLCLQKTHHLWQKGTRSTQKINTTRRGPHSCNQQLCINWLNTCAYLNQPYAVWAMFGGRGVLKQCGCGFLLLSKYQIKVKGPFSKKMLRNEKAAKGSCNWTSDLVISGSVLSYWKIYWIDMDCNLRSVAPKPVVFFLFHC